MENSNIYNQFGIANDLFQNKSEALGSVVNVVSDSISPQALKDGGMVNDIYSSNFKSGVSGWKLSYTGDFEGNSGIFRGSLVANSIAIPDTTTVNSFHVDTAGNAWWGATTLGGATTAKVLNTGAATFTSVVLSGLQPGSSIDGTYVDSLEANKITAGTGIINDLSVKSILTIGSSLTNGIIESYGWDGTANGFRILGGATPSISLIGGTITSGVFRTAISGQRIEINNPGYTNEIAFYNSSNVWTGGLFLESGVLRTGCSPSGSGSAIEYGSNLSLITTGDVTFYGNDLRPLTTGNGDLGSSSYKWGYLYLANNIIVGGTVDGVDISSFLASYNSHISNVNAHHNALSNGYAITPYSVTASAGGRLGNVYVGNVNSYDVLPYANGYGQLGYAAGIGGQPYNRRWSVIAADNIYCTVQTVGKTITGDILFKDLFTINEDETGLRFLNKKGNLIARLDQEGNLSIKGNIKQL
jgi:hypothetical protein